MTVKMAGFSEVLIAAIFAVTFVGATAAASEYVQPWKSKNVSIIIDPYGLNPIDWGRLKKDPRIAGFIHKATEGLAPPVRCGKLEGAERGLCRYRSKYYHVNVELFKTRRTLAKQLGYKWGAYHLGRPGNPVAQAKHFLAVARPGKRDLLALDLEDLDDQKWMSLGDAEVFVEYIRKKTGRYPILYSNHKVLSYIAKHHRNFPVLAKLSVWYARFKPEITGVFPMGPFKTYSLWQFKSEINCKSKSECPYLVDGTDFDMDLNVYPEPVAKLKAKWPRISR